MVYGQASNQQRSSMCNQALTDFTHPSQIREWDEKSSHRERDSSLVEQSTWSFIKFISLLEIFVFVYHVILLAEDGVTVGINGPVSSEVKSEIFDDKSDIST